MAQDGTAQFELEPAYVLHTNLQEAPQSSGGSALVLSPQQKNNTSEQSQLQSSIVGNNIPTADSPSSSYPSQRTVRKKSSASRANTASPDLALRRAREIYEQSQDLLRLNAGVMLARGLSSSKRSPRAASKVLSQRN